ncbi:2-dehydropantoate 2-reductase [Rhabdaerophilum sp. SD176]|uniref:2-dehydropantoate 2-reductase n=1 Tax=Rhabdaerophilum sp. SD176 TaxID=2983548 RepID=UPI0024E0014A|nr:2-dehydropantoate 2-reductase [Rhabdaerophilum sp. SD176]
MTVLGAGAIGGWIAAGFCRAGHDVSILARGGSLAALREIGLVLMDGDRREAFGIRASDDPRALPAAELLVLGLKAHDLPANAPLIAALLGPETIVLPVINGIPWWFLDHFGGPANGLTLQSVDPDGTLKGLMPAHRVIGAVVHAASRVESPGCIRILKADRLLLGDPAGEGKSTAIAQTLVAGGLPAQRVADIRGEVWSKLWGNSNMNPLSALTKADAAQLIDDPGTLALIRGMMAEMAGMCGLIGLPELGDAEARIGVTRKLGAFRTSMLQDLEAGRSLEIGPIIGGLVELSQHLGYPAPLLTGIHALLRLLEVNRG